MNNALLPIGTRVSAYDPATRANTAGTIIAAYDDKPYWVDDDPHATGPHWYTVEDLDGGVFECNSAQLKALYKGVSA